MYDKRHTNTSNTLYNLTTEIKLLREIYLEPGIHKRKLSKKLRVGMPSIDYALKKVKPLLKEKKEGKNLKYFLKYNSKIISFLYQIEYSRLYSLPNNIRFAVFDLLKELKNKPLLTIIFGSYAKGTFTKTSDLDILLVYQKPEANDIENTAKKISMRFNINIEPVYLDFKTFRESFFNSTKKFFTNLKKEKIIITGIEWWVNLKNEEA